MVALLHKLDLAGESYSLTGLRLRGRFRVLPQLPRYAVVSVLAMSLDYAVFLSLVLAGVSPVLAGMIGYPLGLMLHFLLSTTFVFDISAVQKARIRLFGEFALTGVAGLATTMMVIAAATGLAGLAALPAKVLATGASFLLVYSLRRGIVFARPALQR
jgi:putative flippase GtrA